MKRMSVRTLAKWLLICGIGLLGFGRAGLLSLEGFPDMPRFQRPAWSREASIWDPYLTTEGTYPARQAWGAPTYQYWWPFPFPAPEVPGLPSPAERLGSPESAQQTIREAIARGEVTRQSPLARVGEVGGGEVDSGGGIDLEGGSALGLLAAPLVGAAIGKGVQLGAEKLLSGGGRPEAPSRPVGGGEGVDGGSSALLDSVPYPAIDVTSPSLAGGVTLGHAPEMITEPHVRTAASAWSPPGEEPISGLEGMPMGVTGAVPAAGVPPTVSGLPPTIEESVRQAFSTGGVPGISAAESTLPGGDVGLAAEEAGGAPATSPYSAVGPALSALATVHGAYRLARGDRTAVPETATGAATLGTQLAGLGGTPGGLLTLPLQFAPGGLFHTLKPVASFLAGKGFGQRKSSTDAYRDAVGAALSRGEIDVETAQQLLREQGAESLGVQGLVTATGQPVPGAPSTVLSAEALPSARERFGYGLGPEALGQIAADVGWNPYAAIEERRRREYEDFISAGE